MNVVILSPHFPDNHHHFCASLHNMGVTVLGIADEKYENLHDDLKSVLTEYYKVNDIHDYDQLVRAMGYFTHKYGKIDRFESHSEYWLETDARIRTDFNIWGKKNDDVQQIKHKSLMKRKLKKAGVTVAPSKVIYTLKDAITFVKKMGYPVMVNPDVEVGAVVADKISNQEELVAFFENKPSNEYFIEGFINGKRYTFDGLVDRDSKLVFYTSHVFSAGITEMINDDIDLSYYSLREIPKNLEEAGMNIVQAFDIRGGFFHFEFIITSSNQVVACEVNMSPPGGLTMDMLNFANDVDLYKEWAKIVLMGNTTIDYSRKYHCAYIERQVTKNYIHSHEEIMEKFGQLIVRNGPASGIFSAALDKCIYLARSQELNDILGIIDFIQAK